MEIFIVCYSEQFNFFLASDHGYRFSNLSPMRLYAVKLYSRDKISSLDGWLR